MRKLLLCVLVGAAALALAGPAMAHRRPPVVMISPWGFSIMAPGPYWPAPLYVPAPAPYPPPYYAPYPAPYPPGYYAPVPAPYPPPYYAPVPAPRPVHPGPYGRQCQPRGGHWG